MSMTPAHEVGTAFPGLWDLAGGALAIAVGSLYRHGDGRRGMGRSSALFWLGLAVWLVALAMPGWATPDRELATHMGQHIVLIGVAAPLLVAGRLELVGAGLARLRLGRAWRRMLAAINGWLAQLTRPFLAAALHAVAIWLWHAPGPFQLTLRSPAIHAIQHVFLFGSALLFWRAALRVRRRAGVAAGVAILFLTAMHTGALSALLTLSDHLWYPAYAAGLALEVARADQQLAGLVMWVPGALPYLLAALWIGAGLLRSDDVSARHVPSPGARA